ncbi:MAG TPA: FAD-binding oxidoreductase [Thermoguttaceae bacterium]|nr:FAD-binding oxidoreductase [Thermoguttaceae bacterium]
MTTEILPLTETISPADEAAVAAAVRDAHRDRRAIYPIGGGTGLDYGARPSRPGIGLSLGGLNRVIDYPADDMTITVEAGITVAELFRVLASKRQRLPVDIPQADWATIGGVVATAPSGPRRYALGTMRDYVIGLRAVDGLGSAFSSGGRVVKNAAGYNLCRLLVGSLGTLGVITQATLMVRPVPETSALLACDVPDLDTAERLLAALIHTQTVPVAVELQAGSFPQDTPILGPMSEGNAARLIVGFEGTAAEVEWMVERLGEEWCTSGVSLAVTVDDPEAGPLWRWLTEFSADVQIRVRPGATTGVIGRLLELAPQCSIVAHAGDGVIGVHLCALEPAALTSLVTQELRPLVEEVGGNLVVLSYPEEAELTRQEIWGPPGSAAAVMRAIKDRFDPEGILNPGRFVFDEPNVR